MHVFTEFCLFMSQSFLSGNTASPSSLPLLRPATLATPDSGNSGCRATVDVMMNHGTRKEIQNS